MAICPFLSGITFDSAGNFVELKTIECQGSSCQLWNADKGECALKDINLMLIHIDTQHLDKNRALIPKATILLQEYQGNQDLDENGYIYGKDFKIDDNDPDIPKMLKTVQAQPDFPEVTEVWTWQQYLDSLS